MDRMKTFAKYVILIFAFWGVSILLENLALKGMYSKISCQFDSTYNNVQDAFKIDNMVASACNVNGYIEFDLTNTSGEEIEKCYAKVDLFNRQNQLAKTDYIEILNLKPGETRHFKIKFKANNIERFNVSTVKETPDKSNIIDVLGWEIDLSNVFGIDLTNATIFGVPVPEIFGSIKDFFKDGISDDNVDAIKAKAKWAWDWFLVRAKSVPLWAYGIGWCMIVGLL